MMATLDSDRPLALYPSMNQLSEEDAERVIKNLRVALGIECNCPKCTGDKGD